MGCKPHATRSCQTVTPCLFACTSYILQFRGVACVLANALRNPAHVLKRAEFLRLCGFLLISASFCGVFGRPWRWEGQKNCRTYDEWKWLSDCGVVSAWLRHSVCHINLSPERRVGIGKLSFPYTLFLQTSEIIMWLGEYFNCSLLWFFLWFISVSIAYNLWLFFVGSAWFQHAQLFMD
jgi:hypothetical protein